MRLIGLLLTLSLSLASLVAEGQQAASPVIGFLGIASANNRALLHAAFRQGLSEAGYTEGKNVRFEFRLAEGHVDRLPDMAADLVRRRVAVLVATGGPPTALAAKAATATVPIVFTLGSDPVRLGLVASLGRPGGNITGITFISGPLQTKRLQLLHELVPNASVIALLMNPDNLSGESNVRAVQDAARSLGLQPRVLKARTVEEVDAAFAALVPQRANALFVASDGFFFTGARNLLPSRHVTLCPRASICASSSRPAA